MKSFILLLLLCSAVFGEDNDVQIVTTAKTNKETTAITLKEIFTRDGQTNLVRTTKTKAGVVQIRTHRFYYKGVKVGDYVVMPDSAGLTTEQGVPYQVTVEFWPSKEIRSLVFGTNGVILDCFTCTNGIFTPVDGSLIRKANAFTADLRPLLAPEHVANTTPKAFGQEVERFIEKHQDQ